MALFGINNPIGWLAFLSLIPLILLYLIRPKPKEMDIPSLMFFMKAKDSAKQKSFFRKFVRDWLFFIQLLVLSLLALSILSPFLTVKRDIASSNVVLVIDASASSKVKDGGSTRFERGIASAKDYLGRRNSIIIAKGNSLIGLRDKQRNEARTYIGTLTPFDTGSKIGDAILLAGEIIEGSGRVIVLSDMINTEGTPPDIAKSVLKSKGITVDFVNTLDGESENVGIVDVKVDEEATRVFIKNFNSESESIELKVNDENRNLVLGPNKIEDFNFKTRKGITKIEILNDDALDSDNIAFVSVPEEESVRILLISNTKSIYLEAALNSIPGARVDIAEPPIVDIGEYDVYVVNGISESKLLPGTFSDLADEVEKGKSVIVNAQSESGRIDYEDLMPVKLGGIKNREKVYSEQASRVTKDVEFGGIDNYFDTELIDGAISLASAGNGSVVTLKELGDGKVIWYGIMEDASDFKLTPSYPILWDNMVKFLTDQQDIESLNRRTGDVLIFETVKEIKTPRGVVEADSISLDAVGIYEINGKKIAVNLLDERESEINPTVQETTGVSIKSFELAPVKEEVEVDLEIWLIIIVMVLLFLELLYIKMRGDI
jgi:hypothetical protein